MNTLRLYVSIYNHAHAAYARTVRIMLAVICLLLVGTYGYFLKSAAFSAALLEDSGSQIAALSSEVSELETEYLSHIGSLGMAEAEFLGLKETKHISFVERASVRADVITLLDGPRRNAQ